MGADAATDDDAGEVPLDVLILDLSRPAAWGLDEEAPIEVVQTHISVVFVTPTHAYKVKKAIRLWGFIDYGTRAARKHWCEEEVRLNERLAPEIYLGVVPIVRDAEGRLAAWLDEEAEAPGDPVDHAVVMNRVPVETTMLARIEGGTVAAEELRRLAERIADFHQANRLPREEAAWALPSRFARILRQNFKATRAAVPDFFPARVHDGLRTRLARRLMRVRDLIRRRVFEGRMVDGHGDIRLEHVVRYKGRAVVMDCVEFTERLRHVDPLSDMAFLSMDLTSRGRRDLARTFESAYLEHSGDLDSAALLPLYRAYRAHVRAKVDQQIARDPDVGDGYRQRKAVAARRCLTLAWTYARTGAVPPLIVMSGPSGTGKSVLARAIAPWLGARVLRSDVVRKEMLGMEPTERPGASARGDVYGAEATARTYALLLERAREEMSDGYGVVLDGTYLERAQREAARALATERGAPFALVELRADPEEVRARLAERAAEGTDASDADEAVYRQQLAAAEPVDGEEALRAVLHEVETSPAVTALAIADLLESQVDADTEPLGAEHRAVEDDQDDA